ncbi:Protein-lysine N-methyltransferase efm4 [Cryptotrichosporon argae]
MADEELPPSKLGTKAHWDEVYERENRVFDDNGDEGEVWFGGSALHKMRAWAAAHVPASAAPVRVLECGCGNGTLLLSFLVSRGRAQAYELVGVDYSEGSVRLARSVEAARREAIARGELEEENSSDEGEDDEDEDEDEDGDEDGRQRWQAGETVANPATVSWRQADLLRDDLGETFDLVLDKGTYDALALSAEPVREAAGRLPSAVYPRQVARLVRPGGFFLITSCNFTQDEVVRRFTEDGLGESCAGCRSWWERVWERRGRWAETRRRHGKRHAGHAAPSLSVQRR